MKLVKRLTGRSDCSLTGWFSPLFQTSVFSSCSESISLLNPPTDTPLLILALRPDIMVARRRGADSLYQRAEQPKRDAAAPLS